MKEFATAGNVGGEMNRFASLVTLGALALPSTALAQLVPGTPYVRFSQPITYTELTSPTVLFTNTLTSTGDVNLPFDFLFYDRTYNSVSFGTDGAMIMGAGSTVSNVNATPGSTSTPNGWIAPFWDTSQFCTADNGSLGYSILGTAPARVAVFEWKRLNISGCSPADLVSFQVRLYEGSAGRIEIDYGPNQGVSSASATMAMEDDMGGREILFRTCTTNCTGADFTALSGTRITVVQDPGVEIEVTDVVAPAFIPLGVARTVDVEVTNRHGVATGPIDVEVFVSPNGTVGNGVSAGVAQVDVPAYATSIVTVPVVAPTSVGVGTAALVVFADSGDALAEFDEDNNVVVTSSRFIRGEPDVAVQAVAVDATTAAAGDVIRVTARLENVGADMGAAADVGVFLSSNPAVTSGDLELTRQPVTLAAGEVRQVTFDAMIPSGIASGRYTIGVVADPARTQDELSRSNNAAAAPNPIDIRGNGIAIVTTRLPQPLASVPYLALIQTLGAEGPLAFTIEAGQLPDGLGIVETTGEIFGRPSDVGCESFTVRAADGVGTDEQDFMLCVADPAEPLTIVTRGVPVGVVGREYDLAFVATGGEGGTFTWSATGLPDALMMLETGRVVGTPYEVGTFEVTVTASDGTSTAERVFMLQVIESGQLSFVTQAVPDGRIGESFAHQFEATGGVAPYVFTTEFGTLPPGLTLDPSGLLEGTPRVAGRYYFGVRVRDSVATGVAGRDVDAVTIDIRDDGALEIVTASLPAGTVGEAYAALIDAEGGAAPYVWDVVEGALPQGLLGDTNADGSFRMVGTPMSSGDASLLVRVMDQEGRTAQRALSIRVLEPPIERPGGEPNGCAAVAGNNPSASVWLVGLGLVLWVRRRRATS